MPADESDLESEDVLERLDEGVRDTAAGVIATGVGYAVGGPEGAFAGAAIGPLGAQALDLLLARAIPLRRRSAERMLELAVEAAGRSLDEFLAKASDDPQRLLLLASAAEAAARTRLDRKIRALALTATSGVLASDDAIVDAEFLIEAALADFEAPHIAVLQVLANEDSLGRTPPLPACPEWSQRQLLHRLPGYGRVVTPVLMTLLRHGVAVEEPFDVAKALYEGQRRENLGGGLSGVPDVQMKPPTYRVTRFGIELLDRLGG